MSVYEIREHRFLFALLLSTLFFFLEIDQSVSLTPKPIRPVIRLGAPTSSVNGEHISLKFYNAYRRTESAKDALQSVLHNFLENLQKNLTTSSVLQLQQDINGINSEKSYEQLKKITNFVDYLNTISIKAKTFIFESKVFFEISKNESNALLSKLRHVPTANHLSREVKLHLTNFFDEMEYLHLVFSETIEEAMEYIVATVLVTEQTFMEFADKQRSYLRYLNSDIMCCESFMNFLLIISPDLLNCAAGSKLDVVYDVFATTAITTKHILRQLEFRIQKLFNCFLFGNFELRCKFVRDAEHVFDNLFDKIDELQIYYDIKTKKGRITKTRLRDSNTEDDLKINADFFKEKRDKPCLAPDFPEALMPLTLKTCLRFKVPESQYNKIV